MPILIVVVVGFVADVAAVIFVSIAQCTGGLRVAGLF